MHQEQRLPAPRPGDWDWQLDAACRGQDTAMFFAADRERGPRKRNREARAKRVCAACPVVEQCLGWALQVRESYGVWGGLSVDERERLLLQESA